MGKINLNQDEKKELLRLAKNTIEKFLKFSEFKIEDTKLSSLKEKRYGVFVTLKKFGELRGCIGYVEPIKPLYELVQMAAYSAAFEDPRFPPLNKNELNFIKLEISMLGKPHQIEDISEIEIGKHGLIIEKGFNRGLLLPQVATEYGWDVKEFLSHTCLKAGLSPDCWEDPNTKIYVFEGIVFEEE